MPEAAVAAPEDESDSLKRRVKFLEEEVSSLSRALYEAKQNSDAVGTSVFSSLKRRVATQRLQLKSQSDSFWRKKQAVNRLRKKYEALIARLKEIDPDFVEAFTGKLGAEARKRVFDQYGDGAL